MLDIFNTIIILKINTMTTLKVHTIESAPEASKPLLEASQKHTE
jgi:hypothetical protein